MLKFSKVCQILESVEKESARLKMAATLADLYSNVTGKEVDKLTYFLQGILAPPYYGLELGLAEKLSLSAISNATGYDVRHVERIFEKRGDLGLVAEELISKRKQQSLFTHPLYFVEVFDKTIKISQTSGPGSQKTKLRLLSELLNNATPLEARYIMRFVAGELRLGVGDATIIEALAIAFASREEKAWIERAYNLQSDLGAVAKVMLKEGLEGVKAMDITLFKPLRPALAERLPNAHEIFDKLGRCAVEFKYDGFRMQIHKKFGKIKIFSRKLEDITSMFPDIVETVNQLPADNIIFEGEALAFNKAQHRFYSFQETMHRRRKYGIEESAKEYPLHVYVFDMMYWNQSLVDQPYHKRREKVESLFPFKVLKPSYKQIVSSAKEIEQIFTTAINEGLEGVMAKDLNAPYTAGARKFAWIKLKKSYGKSMDTIDAIILGYYRGKGSRAAFEFGGLLVGVLNPQSQRIETIAKVGSGFSEEDMRKIKEMLDKQTTPEKPVSVYSILKPDFWVVPKIVVEVAFDEITISQQHTCCWNGKRGLALRFPRLIRIREEKGIEDATTSKEIEEMFELQKTAQEN